MNLGVTGQKGEDMVAAFLRKQGCAVLKRNYQCRFGELDIIAKKGNLLLFVEVKTRKEGAIVTARESVDGKKINRLTLTAQDYLSKTEGCESLQPRFDVAEVTVSVDEQNKEHYKLNYIKNAF